MTKQSAGVVRALSLRARRAKAAKLFSEGATQADVARRIGVSRVSAMRWYRAWRKGGPAALATARPLGRPARLSAQQIHYVEQQLLKGAAAHGYSTDLWTLPRMAVVIERETGARYHPGHVWRVLRRLGWSLQRPARRARERNEEAIQSWRKRSWPRQKRTPQR
jgi:transposase